MWVSHVAVDGVNDGVPAEGRHEETECDGKCEPVLGEEVGGRWLAEGAGCVGLHETVQDDYANNWGVC